MSKIMVPVYLEPEQKEALMKLSKKTRIPFAVYMREGADMVIKKHKAEVRK